LEKLTEAQAKVVLALMNKSGKSYYEIAKNSGISIEGARKVLKKLIDYGIVKYNPNDKYKRFVLDEKKISIKKSYYVKSSEVTNVYKLLKGLILPSTIGMISVIALSFLLFENALIFFLGGFIVFLFQFFYSFYKISKSEEKIEVFRV